MQTLKKGMSGNLVKYLRKKLADVGYTLPAGDQFDDALDTNVRDYQQKKNLTVDGLVGGQTWVQLYLDTEKPRTANSKLDRHNNILHLHPKVRAAVVKVFTQMQSEGIPMRIFEAYRYPERQNDLYAQGRTKPGNKVTYVKAWGSYHQYGMAVDFVLYIDEKWSWDDSGNKKSWWKRLHEIGKEEGLMPLDFETPHLQIMGTNSSALAHGVYPDGGDASWLNNLNAAKN